MLYAKDDFEICVINDHIISFKGALSEAIPWHTLTMEFKSKEFQSAIRQIPQCDWIERAYEMEKRSGCNAEFGVSKKVHSYVF